MRDIWVYEFKDHMTTYITIQLYNNNFKTTTPLSSHMHNTNLITNKNVIN